MEAFAVRRVQKTNALKEMNPSERRRALSGAFAVEDDWKPKKKVLLVDDIYTTGSTLYQMVQLLEAIGIKEVLTFSLAR